MVVVNYISNSLRLNSLAVNALNLLGSSPSSISVGGGGDGQLSLVWIYLYAPKSYCFIYPLLNPKTHTQIIRSEMKML